MSLCIPSIIDKDGEIDYCCRIFLVKLVEGSDTVTTTLPDITTDGIRFDFKRKDKNDKVGYRIQGFKREQTIDDFEFITMEINSFGVRLISLNGVWETY